MKQYALGVDIGGTTVKLGLFEDSGVLKEKWEIPTDTSSRGENILADIAQSISEFQKTRELPADQILGIGIGVPGPVDAQYTVHRCVNLGWDVFNIKEQMNRLLPDIPNVTAGNDANIAALGELWQGGGKGYQSAVLITLGTGVGGGVVLNNEVIAGANGGAGEIGHITVNLQETVQCGCGKYGCLEQYASANGIVRMGQIMLEQSAKPSALRKMNSFTSKDICDLARDGDEAAKDILDSWGAYLGLAMSCISCTVDPDVYILGGGMSRAGTVIIDAVQKHYRKYAFHVSRETKIVSAELGNDAGIYGGARMILSTKEHM